MVTLIVFKSYSSESDPRRINGNLTTASLNKSAEQVLDVPKHHYAFNCP